MFGLRFELSCSQNDRQNDRTTDHITPPASTLQYTSKDTCPTCMRAAACSRSATTPSGSWQRWRRRRSRRDIIASRTSSTHVVVSASQPRVYLSSQSVSRQPSRTLRCWRNHDRCYTDFGLRFSAAAWPVGWRQRVGLSLCCQWHAPISLSSAWRSASNKSTVAQPYWHWPSRCAAPPSVRWGAVRAWVVGWERVNSTTERPLTENRECR